MRLIDADALKEYKVTGEIGNLSGDFVPGFAIANAPTIEAEPVRHGSWVDGMDYTNSHWRVCSVCHKSAHHPAGGDAFCSNCGAKMDGESG